MQLQLICPYYNLFYAALTVENSSLWKIYIPSEKKIVDDYTLKDTTFWDAYGANSEELTSTIA